MTKSTPEAASTSTTFHFPLPVDFTSILKDAEKRGEILQPHGLQNLCDSAACIITNQNYQHLSDVKISLEETKRRITLRDERYQWMFEPAQTPSEGLDFTPNEEPQYVDSLDEYHGRTKKGPDQ